MRTLCIPSYIVIAAAATLQDGWTALMEAADNGLTATVQSLVAAEVDMNIQGKVSNIILIGAADHSESF